MAGTSDLFERLKGWWAFAVICFVVIAPMEAAEWQLVSGFSHSALIATVFLGGGVILTAVVAALSEHKVVKGLAVSLAVAFVVVQAWAAFLPPATSATAIVRTLYSDHQSVQARNVPGDFNRMLNLDNVATLQVSAPFNLQKITLEWLAVPAVTVENPQTGRDYPMGNETLHIFPHQGTLRGLTMMQGTIVSFDVIANRSRLLRVGDRVFEVTLVKVTDLSDATTPIAYEYDFAISEQEPTKENLESAMSQQVQPQPPQ